MFKTVTMLLVASACLAGCSGTQSTQSTQTTHAPGTSSQTATQTTTVAHRASRPQMVESGSSLITLYANDPVANAFSVDDGEYGKIMRPNGVFNRDSDITFGAYRSGYLSFAMQGGDEAHVINLGTSRELASRYGYDETVGGGQGFASIAFRDGKLTIFENRHDTYQPLREGQTLINSFDPSENEIRPELGHIYIAKLLSEGEPTFVKLMVVAMDPQSWIVLRWERLDPAGAQMTMRGQ